MAISLIAYAKADIRASRSALEAVRAGEGNEKATKGVAAYHAQQAIEKILNFVTDSVVRGYDIDRGKRIICMCRRRIAGKGDRYAENGEHWMSGF